MKLNNFSAYDRLLMITNLFRSTEGISVSYYEHLNYKSYIKLK